MFVACLGLWIAALMALLPDIMGVKGTGLKTKFDNFLLQTTGDFIWTDSGTSSGSAFSCDNDQLRSSCSNVGPSFLHVINLCAVVAFYALIILKLITSKYSHPDNSTVGDNLKAISKPLILLIGAYFAFLLPLAFFESCFSSYTYQSKTVRAGIAMW